MGVIWGDLLVPLPEREKRFVSGQEAKRKVCIEEKNIAPPNVSSGPPLTALYLKVVLVYPHSTPVYHVLSYSPSITVYRQLLSVKYTLDKLSD